MGKNSCIFPLHGQVAMKSPGPLSNPMKAKALIKSPFWAHLTHVLTLFCKAKYLIRVLVDKKKELFYYIHKINKKKKMYNWCSSSHVMPMPDLFPSDLGMYYDYSSWSSVVPVEDDAEGAAPPSGCPEWLEEKSKVKQVCDADGDEINRLAEAFIAHCHEMFRLEKQESYRLYQEMLARGL